MNNDAHTEGPTHSQPRGDESTEPCPIWGPYRSSIMDGLAVCADYLGRLERSLVGEAAPDRYYFSMRAIDLRNAARNLVRLTEDIEGWLITCGEEITLQDDDGPILSSCDLPRGHYGDHDKSSLPSLANQVRDAGRSLIDRTEDVASWVHRLGLLSDQRRAFGIEKEFDPEGWETFAELEQMGRSVHHDATDMGHLMTALVYELPPEDYEDEWNPSAPIPRRARGLDL